MQINYFALSCCWELVAVCVCARTRTCVCMRMCVCVRERESVCVSERESESKCVCVRERERERESKCVWESVCVCVRASMVLLLFLWMWAVRDHDSSCMLRGGQHLQDLVWPPRRERRKPVIAKHWPALSFITSPSFTALSVFPFCSVLVT